MQSQELNITEGQASQLNGKTSAIPLLDLKAQFAEIREEVMAAVARVMESQHFVLGPEVTALEKEIAAFVECKFAVACASGSDALLLSLMARGIGTGDEVVTTPFTFGATAGAIARLGARPVFVDIDPATYNLDAAKLEAAITPRTRSIMPVHLFGLSADMSAILKIARRHNLLVVEDSAQAIGAKFDATLVGGLGDVGCFSFFPSKNLGGSGDGGMVVTNDAEIADAIKVLSLHGTRKKYRYERLGMNSRLDALQAAILRVKLKHLPKWTAERQRNAERYGSLFGEYDLADSIGLPVTPAGCVHVYNQYVIRVKRRDELKVHLQNLGIATEIYYPGPLHTQPAFESLGYHAGDFPISEVASQEVLALPIYPELSAEQQRSVVEGIASFVRGRR